jgi:hypothetical protein
MIIAFKDIVCKDIYAKALYAKALYAKTLYDKTTQQEINMLLYEQACFLILNSAQTTTRSKKCHSPGLQSHRVPGHVQCRSKTVSAGEAPLHPLELCGGGVLQCPSCWKHKHIRVVVVARRRR